MEFLTRHTACPCIHTAPKIAYVLFTVYEIEEKASRLSCNNFSKGQWWMAALFWNRDEKVVSQKGLWQSGMTSSKLPNSLCLGFLQTGKAEGHHFTKDPFTVKGTLHVHNRSWLLSIISGIKIEKQWPSMCDSKCSQRAWFRLQYG